MQTNHLFVIRLATTALFGACAVACSSANTGTGSSTSTPEATGEIVAELTTVPDDVQCVAIWTNDSEVAMLATVAPGGTASIHFGSVRTGIVEIRGEAFDQPCLNPLAYPDDGGPPGEEGAAPSDFGNETWEADSAMVHVVTGITTQVRLDFHRVGTLNVTATFGLCADTYSDYCDAGPSPDGGFFDAGLSKDASALADVGRP